MTQRQAGITDLTYWAGARCRSLAASLLCAASLMTLPAGADTSEPIEIAIFDFEFEDFSAGASATGETASDAAHLAKVTSEVRQLFSQSGRYRLVDVGGTDTKAVKERTLRKCNGCDAAVALRLGADQSFVGVVKRITRKEYAVRFQIRDAKTGDVVSGADSGPRMGADYSWSRGAVRLIKDRLLEKQAQQ